MRTPSNALLIGSGLPSLVHRLILGARRILARVNPDVDDRRAAVTLDGLARTPQRRGDLRRLPHFFAVAAQHLREFAERHVPQETADIAALLTVFCELAVTDLVHRGVVADYGDVGDTEAIRGLHVERRHAEGAITVIAEHLAVRMGQTCGDREARADTQRAERPRIHPLAGAARTHGLS